MAKENIHDQFLGKNVAEPSKVQTRSLLIISWTHITPNH